MTERMHPDGLPVDATPYIDESHDEYIADRVNPARSYFAEVAKLEHRARFAEAQAASFARHALRYRKELSYRLIEIEAVRKCWDDAEKRHVVPRTRYDADGFKLRFPAPDVVPHTRYDAVCGEVTAAQAKLSRVQADAATEIRRLENDLVRLRESWDAQQASIREGDRLLRSLAQLVDLDVLDSWARRNGLGEGWKP